MTATRIRPDLPSAPNAIHDWESAIQFLDTGLYEALKAREELANAEMAIEIYEAHAFVNVEGRNDAERKARLTIALSEQVAYADLIDEQRKAQERLRDAERIICLNKERARLARAVLELLVNDDTNG